MGKQGCESMKLNNNNIKIIEIHNIIISLDKIDKKLNEILENWIDDISKDIKNIA